MLIEFTVGNYRSFKDPVTFSMVAAKLTAKNKGLDRNNVFAVNDALGLLKSCAVYGANASGKSNLVHAFHFMRRFVLGSSKDSQAGEPIDVDPFRLSTETQGKPSFFEMVFVTEGKRYRYGFTVDKEHVHTEWLYHAQVRETNLFYREGDDFELSSVFKEGKGLPDKTRDNALFLSVVAQFNGEIALIVLEWFRELDVKFSIEDVDRQVTIARLEDESVKNEIMTFIKQMDLGIIDLKIKKEKLPRSEYYIFQSILEGLPSDEMLKILESMTLPPVITTVHKIHDGKKPTKFSVVFDLDTHESEGTKKLFALAGSLFNVLQDGKTLVIDELDARLHPLLTEAIIKLFNSNDTNPNNAQLIFTTHDTNLLTNKLFRRDQIWFTEKNKYGATDLYSLAEFKVRNDASYEKDYIAGKYGAIPFIGGLRRLMAEETDG